MGYLGMRPSRRVETFVKLLETLPDKLEDFLIEYKHKLEKHELEKLEYAVDHAIEDLHRILTRLIREE